MELKLYTSATAAEKSEPELLAESRRLLADEVMQLTRGMMDQVDDTLFALADKAENNAIQSQYFDAMREVRIQRSLIEEGFEAQVLGLADGALETGGSDMAGGSSGLELSLVGQDDLEIDLAISNLTRKVEDVAGNELPALERRLRELSGVRYVAGALSPRAICKAFAEACAVIESGIEVRILILKLFDKHVAVHLPGIYSRLNQYLARQGILPDLRPEPSDRARQTARERARHDAPQAQEEAAQAPPQTNDPAVAGDGNLFAMLQRFLGWGGAGGPSGFAPGGSGHPGDAGGGFPGAGAPAALADLTLLQRGDATALAERMPSLDPVRFAAGTVNVISDLRDTDMARSMGSVDQMTIDIVAMMFDYILGDRNLPDRMKATIGRLQIPVLKVAILDKEFFARRAHPARKLLDTLAEAAVGWNEEHPEDQALHREAERIVEAVLEGFDDDTGIFARLLSELDQFLAREGEQAETRTEESAKVIRGREQLQEAKEAAAAAVQSRLDANDVPPAVCHLLQGPWQELLVLHHVHGGPDSLVWKEGLEVMDSLIWSVTPKADADERHRLVEALPKLLPRVNRGLVLAAVTKAEREELFSGLSALHAAAVRPPPAPSPGAAEGDSTETGGTPAPPAPKHVAEPWPLDDLAAAVHLANRQIYDTAEARPQCKGMGSTLVGVLFHDNRVNVAHVGDSRLYRLREERFEQLTKDHSLVQELIDQGFFSPEEAREFPRKNVVTRAMGAGDTVRPGLAQHTASVGDLYLLCSDGLTDLVDDARIQSLLTAWGGDLQGAAAALVAEANEREGKDNISVVLVKVTGAFPVVDEDLLPVPLEQALDTAALTDVGRKRAHNEDAIEYVPRLGLAVLADGMGGANAGEVASELAVMGVCEHLRRVLPMAAARVAEDGAGQDATDEDREEIVLSASGPTPEPLDIDDEHMAVVRAMQVGDWVEFRRGEGDTVRARLSWVSSATGAYLFTNRKGIKVMDATPHGLAIELRRGSALLMEQTPLIERAVGSLSARLVGPGK